MTLNFGPIGMSLTEPQLEAIADCILTYADAAEHPQRADLIRLGVNAAKLAVESDATHTAQIRAMELAIGNRLGVVVGSLV